jgi:hypothetical protein
MIAIVAVLEMKHVTATNVTGEERLNIVRRYFKQLSYHRDCLR